MVKWLSSRENGSEGLTMNEYRKDMGVVWKVMYGTIDRWRDTENVVRE